jgi:hypothetical protein
MLIWINVWLCKIERTGDTGKIKCNNYEIKEVENPNYLGSKIVINSRAQEEIKVWMKKAEKCNQLVRNILWKWEMPDRKVVLKNYEMHIYKLSWMIYVWIKVSLLFKVSSVSCGPNTKLGEILNGSNLTLTLFTWDQWNWALNGGNP